MKRTALSLCLLMIVTATARGDDRTITFAGLTWNVREEQGGAPGPNRWSASDKSVWVDARGQLHMRFLARRRQAAERCEGGRLIIKGMKVTKP